MEKIWVVEDPDQYLNPRQKQPAEEDSPPEEEEKDPALAYTLSMLFWGMGQMYNGQRVKGLSYICIVLYGNIFALLAFVFEEEIPFYLRSFGTSPAQALLAALFLLFSVLIFWVSNASDAYHTAVKARRTPFIGVTSRAWPVFCSLLVPGWGQYLNGQPVKGALFAGWAVLSAFSVAAVQCILLAWPSLESSDSRLIVEGVFLVSLLLLLPMPILWTLGAFDAWKVSRDDIKKEPLLERLKAANNRRRTHGWVRGVFPQIRTTLLLSLFLAFLLIIINQYYFPRNFYRGFLAEALNWSTKQGMTLIPELITRILAILPAA